jgi:hypothetical protein
MAIGETSRIESTDKDKVQTLVQKVKDLNSRLQDVRREQVFQRVCHTVERADRTYGIPWLTPFTGARSRVPRPVRTYQLSRRSLDTYPTRYSRCYLRLATVALASFLHQAEAYLESSSIIYDLFRFRGPRDDMTGDEEKACFTWVGGALLYRSCRIWRCNNGLVG